MEINIKQNLVSLNIDPNISKKVELPTHENNVTDSNNISFTGQSVEASCLDIISNANRTIVHSNSSSQNKTAWTKDELFYMGFTNLAYFEETTGNNWEKLYKLKSDAKVNDKEIHSIEELQEALNVVSIDKFLEGDEYGYSLSGYMDGFNFSYHNTYQNITADAKCSADWDGTHTKNLKTLIDNLKEIAERDPQKYYTKDCVDYLYDVLGIQYGEEEDSIREKLNTYFKNIGGTTEDGVNYSVNCNQLKSALYNDSEDFKKLIDERFARENSARNLRNGYIDSEHYGADGVSNTFTNIVDQYSIKQYYINKSADPSYGDKNYEAFLKVIEQAAGVTSSDTEWYQKMPKIEALLEKIASQLTYDANPLYLEKSAICSYLTENGYIEPRTYTEADLNVFRSNNLNVEDYFDTIQNEDGSISYKMKTNLIRKDGNKITSMDWLIFNLDTGKTDIILPSLAPEVTYINNPTTSTCEQSEVITVSSPQDLLNIKDNLSATIVLACDIDMTGIDWTPIGSVDSPFTGQIIGNGFTIKNLTIKSDAYNSGFLGVADNAVISGLKFENVNIENTNNDSVVSTNPLEEKTAGVLAGLMKNCNITNVEIIDSTVKGKDSAGLLCGKMIHCDGKDIKVTGGKVYGNYAVGGAVGNTLDTVIEGCEVKTDVKGGVWTGGIFGAYSGRKFYSGDVLNYYARSKDLDFEGTVIGGSNNLGAGGIYGQTDIALCENFYPGYEASIGHGVYGSTLNVQGNCAGAYAGYSCELSESGDVTQMLPIDLTKSSWVIDWTNTFIVSGEHHNEYDVLVGYASNQVVTATPEKYLAEFQAIADSNGLTPTAWKGVYFDEASGNYCIAGRFYDMKEYVLDCRDIADILAMEFGYNLTMYPGVYEKDGKYYQYQDQVNDTRFHFDESQKNRMLEKYSSGMMEISLESIVHSETNNGQNIPPVENQEIQTEDTATINSVLVQPVVSNDKSDIQIFDIEDVLKDMGVVANKYGLISSEQQGLYYSYKDSERYAMIWDVQSKRFHSFAINVKMPNGTVLKDFTASGKALNRTIENLYFEALAMAYIQGYSPTSKLGVFYKDGKYYEYDVETGVFKLTE